MVRLNINGDISEFEVDPAMPLLWALRDAAQLTGTKFGCGRGLCGACTVHLDGQPARACVTPVGQVGDRRVTTIEGARDPVAQRVIAAWIHLDVAQCGYCQPGQVMTATALLRDNPRPTDADIDRAMGGNLCRCGTYPRIRAAIHLAAEGSPPPATPA